MNLDYNAFRNVAEQTCEPVITYISTCNPQNPELFNVIKSNLLILQEDPKVNDNFIKFQID